MKQEHLPYYAYSDYLKEKYNEKVYKLPVNLPVGCPNRADGAGGCSFCAECGTGFEAMDSSVPVIRQLETAKKHIESKYHAHKFIAYFQNYTNTFLPTAEFECYLKEAARMPGLAGIAVSTRPDCIREDYLEILKKISVDNTLDITIELGLQTVNYHTLAQIGRGHGLAEFIDAVLKIQKYGFEICSHVILNLPGDELSDCIETSRFLSALKINVVKIHSLYIAKNTRLCDAYENGTISVCSKDEYVRRLIAFLENLDPSIAVERLFSRIPQKDAVFSNWGISWWRLRDEVVDKMQDIGSCQGKSFHYLNGAALDKIQEA